MKKETLKYIFANLSDEKKVFEIFYNGNNYTTHNGYVTGLHSDFETLQEVFEFVKLELRCESITIKTIESTITITQTT